MYFKPPIERLPRLRSVRAVPGRGRRLAIRFADGRKGEVDIANLIARFEILRQLDDAGIFAHPRLADYGSGVEWWDGRPSVSASTLSRLLEWQKPFGAQELRAWLSRHSLSAEEFARAAGRSKRQVAEYLRGGRQVPRMVLIYCRAADEWPPLVTFTIRPGSSRAAVKPRGSRKIVKPASRRSAAP